jgi:hypothetical protein
MNINEIIKESILIKNDSVRVFKYKEQFIIKEKKYSISSEKYAYIEKEYLKLARKE